MSLQLLVVAGPDKGRIFPLTKGDGLLLGRGKTTDNRLTDPRISKVHCKIDWTDRGVVVADQNSTGGTYVNGRRVTEDVLKPGDILRIGETDLRLQQEITPAPEEGNDQTMAGPMLAPTRPGPLGELAGQMLSHYRIGPVVARGTSGVIFQADDTVNHRRVAVKVLAPELVRDDQAMQRFVRAMRTLLPIRHPNLVALYGAGKSGPYCWSAMEYVEGENLAQIMERRGRASVLDWRPPLRYAVHVARALEHAHKSAVIHRNITPKNVLVRKADDAAKLGDLMLAKALQGLTAENITRPGDVVGDVHYLAPECLSSGAEADERSDLYSLGALTYALLTGRPPFEAANAVDTAMMICKAEPAPPTERQPAIPAALSDVVLRLLRKQPRERFPSAGEVVQALTAIAGAHGMAV